MTKARPRRAHKPRSLLLTLAPPRPMMPEVIRLARKRLSLTERDDSMRAPVLATVIPLGRPEGSTLGDIRAVYVAEVRRGRRRAS